MSGTTGLPQHQPRWCGEESPPPTHTHTHTLAPKHTHTRTHTRTHTYIHTNQPAQNPPLQNKLERVSACVSVRTSGKLHQPRHGGREHLTVPHLVVQVLQGLLCLGYLLPLGLQRNRVRGTAREEVTPHHLMSDAAPHHKNPTVARMHTYVYVRLYLPPMLPPQTQKRTGVTPTDSKWAARDCSVCKAVSISGLNGLTSGAGGAATGAAAGTAAPGAAFPYLADRAGLPTLDTKPSGTTSRRSTAGGFPKDGKVGAWKPPRAPPTVLAGAAGTP